MYNVTLDKLAAGSSYFVDKMSLISYGLDISIVNAGYNFTTFANHFQRFDEVVVADDRESQAHVDRDTDVNNDASPPLLTHRQKVSRKLVHRTRGAV